MLDNQRIALIGSVGATWISLGGLLILAALFDHEIATIVVQAFVAIALGSGASSAAIHIWGQPTIQSAIAPGLAHADKQTIASLAASFAPPAPPAQPAAPAVSADPNAAGGEQA